MLDGVDVSSWQAGWTPGEDDQFVFVKATEGTGYRNPERDSQLDAARSKALQVGHYHFLAPGNPVGQARYFVDSTDLKAGDLLVCDWEGDWARGTHPSVEEAAAFIAEVKRLRPTNLCGLYCNRSDWMATAVKAGDFLWVAEYGVDAPAISGAWDFWQYTDTPIDRNRSRFASLPDLKRWALQLLPTPAPTVPGPVGRPVPPAERVRHSTKWDQDYIGWKGSSANPKGQGWVSTEDWVILSVIADTVAPWWGPLDLMQGGLSTSVAASADTHAGLGCFDVQTWGRKPTGQLRTAADVIRLAAVFNASGLLFFARGFYDDSFQGRTIGNVQDGNEHGHVVSRESFSSLHPQAQAQLREYQRWAAGTSRDGDGLVRVHGYYGPATPLGKWVDSPYHPDNQVADDQTYYVTARPSLLGLDDDRRAVTDHPTGHPIKASHIVDRWGRPNVVATTGLHYALEFLSLTPVPAAPPAPTPEPPMAKVRFTVATLNGRRRTADVAGYPYAERKPRLQQLVADVAPSVLGVQEYTDTMRDDLPYSWYGRGNVAVGWLEDMWEKIHDGAYDLQTGDDDRWAVAVVLRHRASGLAVKFVSTHLTNLEAGKGGDGWRLGQAGEIADNVRGVDVLFGDFNDDGPVYTFLGGRGLVDARKKAVRVDGDRYSSTHPFGRLHPTNGRWIDNVLTAGHVGVGRVWLKRTDRESAYPDASDHGLIAADLELDPAA